MDEQEVPRRVLEQALCSNKRLFVEPASQTGYPRLSAVAYHRIKPRDGDRDAEQQTARIEEGVGQRVSLGQRRRDVDQALSHDHQRPSAWLGHTYV